MEVVARHRTSKRMGLTRGWDWVRTHASEHVHACEHASLCRIASAVKSGRWEQMSQVLSRAMYRCVRVCSQVCSALKARCADACVDACADMRVGRHYYGLVPHLRERPVELYVELGADRQCRINEDPAAREHLFSPRFRSALRTSEGHRCREPSALFFRTHALQHAASLVPYTVLVSSA